MANRYWPGEDPLGKRIKLGAPQTAQPWLTIVGVVGNVKHYALEDKTRPEFYRPFQQSAERKPSEVKLLSAVLIVDHVSLVMRVAGSPEDIADAARKMVWSFDPDQPISRLVTMEELLNEAVAPRRFNMVLFGALAGAALLLAAVGIYANNMARPAFWRANAVEGAQLHSDCRDHTGAWYWREHGDLQRRQRGAAETVALWG